MRIPCEGADSPASWRHVAQMRSNERNTMNRRLFAALVLAAALPAAASERAGSTSAPTPTPAAGIPSRPGAMQLAPVATLPNRFGTPGEKIKLEADVKQDGAPLAGLKFTFSVDGKNAGDATSDASGKALLDWKVPDNFVQKHYEVKATAPHVSAKGDLSIFKSATKMTVANFTWGTYKGEAGPPSGTYTFMLTRTSDGNAIVNPPVPVDVTVNGAPYNPGNIKSDAAIMPLPDLPAGQKTWKVKVAFSGNASYLASSDEQTFTKP
jgi:hypothetical protein